MPEAVTAPVAHGTDPAVAPEEAASSAASEAAPANAASKTAPAEPAALLMKLKGIGPEFAAVLWLEALFRSFGNRRQIAAYAGLAPVPWQSGGIDRDQGIAKAGNPRLRKTMIQVAWLWIRHQPGSAISQWFAKRVGTARGRVRRIAIVAVARKLLVALVALRDPGRRSGGRRPEGLRSHIEPKSADRHRTGFAGPGGRWPLRALAARRRLTEWPRPSEPLVLVQEEFWCGWCPPTGCEVMRPTGSHDEIGARGLDLGNAQSVRSGQSGGAENPAGTTSTGNGLQHPHSENDDGRLGRRPQAWPCGPPPLSGGCGLDRAGPVDPRSTIGMKDAEVLSLPNQSTARESLFTQGAEMRERRDRRAPSTNCRTGIFGRALECSFAAGRY